MLVKSGYFWLLVDILCVETYTMCWAETVFSYSKRYSLVACLSVKVNHIFLSCIFADSMEKHICVSFHSCGDFSLLVLHDLLYYMGSCSTNFLGWVRYTTYLVNSRTYLKLWHWKCKILNLYKSEYLVNCSNVSKKNRWIIIMGSGFKMFLKRNCIGNIRLYCSNHTWFLFNST